MVTEQAHHIEAVTERGTSLVVWGDCLSDSELNMTKGSKT